MGSNVADNRLPEAVRLIGGLCAAPTTKALRVKAGRVLEGEPASEPKRAAATGHAERLDPAKAVPQAAHRTRAYRAWSEGSAPTRARLSAGSPCQSGGRREALPKQARRKPETKVSWLKARRITLAVNGPQRRTQH